MSTSGMAAAPLDLLTSSAPLSPGKQRAVIVCRWCVPGLVVLGWFVASQFTDLVAPVGFTMDELVRAFSEGWIWVPLWSTMSASIPGFMCGAALAVPGGYLLGRSRLVSDVFEPLVMGAYAVPRIILYPIILMILGVGGSSKFTLAVLSAFFPVLVSTTAGIRAVNPLLFKLGRSLNCSRWQLATKIFFPGAAPTILVGLRIGFSISFVSVIVAELFAAVSGLGLVVSRTYALLQLPQMYATILVIVSVAIAGNTLLWAIEQRIRVSP